MDKTNMSYMQLDSECVVKGSDKHVPKRHNMNYEIKNSHQWKVLCRKHVDYLVSPQGERDVHALTHLVKFDTPGRVGNWAPDEIAIPTTVYNNFKHEIIEEITTDFETDGNHAKLLSMNEFEQKLQNPEAPGCRKIQVKDSVKTINLAKKWGVLDI